MSDVVANYLALGMLCLIALLCWAIDAYSKRQVIDFLRKALIRSDEQFFEMNSLAKDLVDISYRFQRQNQELKQQLEEVKHDG